MQEQDGADILAHSVTTDAALVDKDTSVIHGTAGGESDTIFDTAANLIAYAP